MQIQIKQAGLLSTIQDCGRPFYRSEAVPLSGAMDTLSARIANVVIGNDENDAVIEFTYAGASFTTLTNVLISYVGGGALLQIEKQVLPVGRPLYIPAGKTVILSHHPDSGCRGYIAIAGGWNVPKVLGSRSTYITAKLGGYKGSALQKNNVLESVENVSRLTKQIYHSLIGEVVCFPNWYVDRTCFWRQPQKVIRVLAAPETDWFTPEAITFFFQTTYCVGQQSNRMGCSLEGAVLQRKTDGELLSTAVIPGTVQVSNNGQPLLLLADCQTTGGYPRIAQVVAVDLPLCGQLKPGDVVQFTQIGYDAAEKFYLEREQALKKIAQAIQLKYYL